MSVNDCVCGRVAAQVCGVVLPVPVPVPVPVRSGERCPPSSLSVLTLDVLLELDEVDGAQFLHLWFCGGGHAACFCANRLPVHRREKQSDIDGAKARRWVHSSPPPSFVNHKSLAVSKRQRLPSPVGKERKKINQ